MKCNICDIEEATIHLTEIVNSKMVELHLCEQCAYEKGSDVKQYFNFSELLGGLAETDKASGKQKTETLSACSTCGMTFEDFAKTGRLGCPDCYKTFYQSLIPLIKRVHRSIQHLGKHPKNVSQETQHHVELRELHEQLRKLVEHEEFEQAAKIRDQIKKMESPEKQKRKKTDASE